MNGRPDGEPLRADVEIESAMVGPFVDVRTLFSIALETGGRSWPDIFQYTSAQLPEQLDRSMWRFRMFDAHEFAITDRAPKGVKFTA